MVVQLLLLLQQLWQQLLSCCGACQALLLGRPQQQRPGGHGAAAAGANRRLPGGKGKAAGVDLEAGRQPLLPVEAKVPKGPPKFQEQWDQASVRTAHVVVRAVSGSELYSREGVTPNMPVSELLLAICEQTGNECEVVQLCAGTEILKQGLRVGDCVGPPAEDGGALELTLLRLPGPPLEVSSASGLPIRLLEAMPEESSRCHLDRNYRFTSLGDFAKRPGMRYIQTSNQDKVCPPDEVMWSLKMRVPMIVYLNFRSERHVSQTGARTWLAKDGWELSDLKGTVSTGIPNGPYKGPVYCKSCEPGTLQLMGSNCDEGTYFVFVESEAWM